MITTFNHLTPVQLKPLQDLIAVIVQDVQPEKIVCYGARTKAEELWSCFVCPIGPWLQAVYDLLIITRKNEKKNTHEILDKIDSYKINDVRVTAVVHTITAVEEALKDESEFFTTLINEGVTLYDRKKAALIAIQGQQNIRDRILKVMRLWNKWFSQGEQFLRGASYLFSTGCKELSAFMLHQAFEHTSIALVSVCTGYRPATHNLNRLLAMTENFTPHLAVIFPKNTREEIDLFNTLSRAYSDARYKEGFRVEEGKLSILIHRITAFQYEAEKIYRAKLARIKECDPCSTVCDHKII